jgi:hypothetical protein
MLSLILALALTPQGCPMTIGINDQGTLFSSRFAGWYQISARTLDSDLKGGCYNDANPIAVTSVVVLVAPGAPKPKTERVFEILKVHGWSRDKIEIKSWDGKPL